MTTSTFLIGPIKDGVRKDVKPFAIPEDAFEELINAYQWRGRVVRRQGYTKLGRLANGTPVMGLRTMEGFGIDVQTLIAFDTTASYEWNGSAFVSLPSVMPVTWSGADYQFFFTTNYASAFWATNSKAGLNGWAIQLFAGSAGVGAAATVNVTAAGNSVAVNDRIYFLNVTGVPAANNLVFGIVTAIIVPGISFTVQVQNPSSGAFVFANGVPTTGMVLDSMKTKSGQDGIRYYGTLQNGTGWANYNPPIDPNNALAGALMIFPYRGYLVFLNTSEGNDGGVQNYGNRARWTQIGTPYYSYPVPNSPALQGIDPLTMRDDLFGRGGANDAPTNEVIVSAGFIRDILVVYFERSTWRLRFVNNSQNPFVWERVNIELGSDCTFSAIPFDKGLMAIGNRGITISDGNDTQRFDDKIPNQIFDIVQSNFGFQRVYGIRTFQTKLNYWTFHSERNDGGTYPDSVLVYNYDTQNWSIFYDSFTCFGYYYPSASLVTWADLTDKWSSYTNPTTDTWTSGASQVGAEKIVAGNQQGYVFVVDQNGSVNDPSLSISAMTDSSITLVATVLTSNNHNLQDGEWIVLSGVTGITFDDGVSLNGRSFQVNNPTQNQNTFGISEFKPINGGLASGTSYQYKVSYKGLVAGSPQINIGSLIFTDPEANGVLVEASSLGSGTINYTTGLINLTFSPAIASTQVYIRIVSYDPLQGLQTVSTLGTYNPGGEITIVSNIGILTKIFNFFGDNQKSRLSKIDFYVDTTPTGQFTCNVFGDSSNNPVNTPLRDNLQGNVVLTTPTPYQVQDSDETIYRLFCDATASTLQLQLTFNDQQMATPVINQNDVQLLAMMINMRKGGRII